MTRLREAPEWNVESWLNSDNDLSLAQLRGQVIVAYVFQMLCRGCVEQSIPQAKRVHDLFNGQGVQVLGLHSVFENHAAMGRGALEAFIREHGVTFPVAIDMPAEQGNVPLTMQRYQMQGTPTLVLIDRQGRLRRQYLGHLEDLRLGAEVMALLHDRLETSSTTPCHLD